MEVVKLYWWKHNCKDGQYSSARVHRTLHVTPKTEAPHGVEDYEIRCDRLDGLEPEILNEF